MKTYEKTEDVARFFDSISEGYDDKYSKNETTFLGHFFTGRLKEATRGMPRKLAVILDIGAGTGQLYSFLEKEAIPTGLYHAVDISAGMLYASRIPADRRYVGTVHLDELDFLKGRVEYFFMLGVTTYMSEDAIVRTFERIRELSCPSGSRFVCTFTNKGSIEHKIQWFVATTLKLIGRVTRRHPNFVAAQEFPRYPLTRIQMTALVSRIGSIERTIFLNQTFTPFNRIFTGTSLYLERIINNMFSKRPNLLSVLSSDILFEVSLVPLPADEGEFAKRIA